FKEEVLEGGRQRAAFGPLLGQAAQVDEKLGLFLLNLAVVVEGFLDDLDLGFIDLAVRQTQFNRELAKIGSHECFSLSKAALIRLTARRGKGAGRSFPT